MIEQAHLESIVASVWQTIFGVDPEPAPFGESAAPTLVARIDITGGLAFRVTIECGERLARHIAALMLGVPDDSLGSADVHDALGEVANMLGGNLKALLPSGHHLTLPDVWEGSADDRAVAIGRYACGFAGERLRVTVRAAAVTALR